MRHHLSASRIGVARRCLWWARPDVVLPERETTEASELGTALHEAAEEHAEDLEEDLRAAAADGDIAAIAERRGLAPAKAAELRALYDAWRDWWATYSGGAPWRAEVPFAIDLATGEARELPSTGQRDYSAARETEIPGTVDVVLVEEDEAVVVDLKTGRPPKRVSMYWDQLLHGAIAARRVLGAERVRVVIAHVTPDGVETDKAALDGFDLDLALAELRATFAGAIESAEPRPGPHCKGCPAAAVCPETSRALAEIAPDPDRRRLLSGPIEDVEHARILVQGLPLLKAWIKEREKALEAFASREPVPLGEGLWFGAVEHAGTERIEVDRAALEVIRRHLGAAADDAIEMKATKTGIERGARAALVASGQKRGIGKLKDAVLEDLRKAGRVKRGAPHTRFEIFERKGGE